ncbi:MAG: hypothetical protein GAK45_01971 [Pseudomonas citronellolis]|nr:MAG: hypothetical protein GAK45_01971 [Pseudomonas citronellolis]
MVMGITPAGSFTVMHTTRPLRSRLAERATC